MITLQNHNEKIKSIDLSNAPEPLKKGKELFEKSAKFYDKSDAIKKTIDLYIAKLNEYAAKEEPYSDIDVEKINKGMPSKMMTEVIDKIDKPKTPKATKPKVEQKKVVKSEPKAKVKKATTKKTAKAPCKPKTVVKTKVVNLKPKKAPVTRSIKSLELQLLNRYKNMDGRKYIKANLVKFSNDIKKAFESDFLADHVTLLKEIRTSINSAVEKMEEAGVQYLDVNLNDATKAKVEAILKNPQIKLRVEYLGDSGMGK